MKTAFFEDIIDKNPSIHAGWISCHFVGPSGVGKTSLALYIAHQLNKPVSIIRGHHELSNKDLLGYHYGFLEERSCRQLYPLRLQERTRNQTDLDPWTSH